MTPLSSLLTAAMRVLSGRGADGMPPETHADARALAEFVRDLLGAGPDGRVEAVTANRHYKVGIEVIGGRWHVSTETARRLAADLLRAIEAAEGVR